MSSPHRPGVHRLSDPAFAALAAGRPDAATVEVLRRSQLSRHLLLLRGIVRAAPEARPPYERLAAAQRAAPERVRELLRHPLVGIWAAGCLTALRSGASPQHAGIDRLTALARAAEAPSRPVGRGLDGARPDGTRPDGARRLTAEHDGLRLDVLLDDADPLRDHLGLTPTGRLTRAEVTHWRDCLQSAWRLLVSRHRDHARLISAVLTCVIPVEPDGRARGISASSADGFGAVAMSTPADAVAMAVGLLHETQHSVLNAVHYLFHLVDGPPEVGYSPWRDDPRPALGVLHGAYAYLAVTDFWRVHRRDGDPVAAFEFARWRAAVAAATGDLLDGGTLTAAGTRFVGALRERVLPWLDEPVPPMVLRLATGANTDHRLRWRLHNLIPDPEVVHALTTAWPADRPPAPADPGSSLRPGSRRVLEDSTRLELAHRLLRDGTIADSGPGGAGGGDAAYVRGDAPRAAQAYRWRLRADPGDDGAWAGLALVTGHPVLREHVEVVAAVHRVLAAGPGPVPDPVHLAEWINSAR